MVRIRSLAFALGVVIVAAGCGGDGSSVNSGAITNQSMTPNNVSNGPNSGDVGIFITDSLNTKYDHVWVSIKKIELKLAAGGLRTIFDDSRGVGIDLSSLRDDSGPKYRFLNELTLPAGTYVGAQITLAHDAVVFPTNATTGKSLGFANQQDNAQDATLTVQFDPPKMLGGGHDDLVFDFDLSKWTDDSGKLTAVVSPSLGAGLEDADRNAAVVQDGVIDDIKNDVPAQAITLKKDKAEALSVLTTSATALVTESSDAPLVLAKGQTVEVSGSFDANTRHFDATSIRLEDPKAPVLAQVYGAVASIDTKTDTWTVTPSETRGLIPQSTTIPISLSSSAKFFGSSGLTLSKDDFFKALSASKSVHLLAEGTYDAAKSAFLASEVRMQDADPQPAVKVAGVVSNPQSASQTFGLTVTGFAGLMTKPGADANVAISPTTTFTDVDGKALTADQFFSALQSPKAADVDGVLDTSTGNVLASSVKLSVAPVTPVKGAKYTKTAKVTPKK